MNFLQLCQRVQQEANVGGPAITDVATETGERARVVGWVKSAWREILAERRDWKFRWAELNEDLTAGTDTYDLAALVGVGEIRLSANRYGLEPTGTAAKRRPLPLLDYPLFQDRYWGAAPATAGFPSAMTLLPDGKKIRFDAPLDVGYTLTGSYYVAAQDLAANTDTPILPTEYHDAIIYRALNKYAKWDEATTVILTSAADDARWSDMLYRDLLPSVGVGANALA